MKPNPSNRFATTSWSLVVSAAGPTEISKDALQQLCQTYWRPLYLFARRKTQSADEAQDLTQAFFAELLEKNFIAAATPDRGRFRSFLLTAFKNFMAKQWHKVRTQKRGGGQQPLSLDFESADSQLGDVAQTSLTPEQIFEQQWVIALLNSVLMQLRQEYEQLGQEERFDSLKGYVIGDHPGTTYSDVASKIGISEAAAKKSASRMRRRYRQILREEIFQTVTDRSDVDDEIRSLFNVFEEK